MKWTKKLRDSNVLSLVFFFSPSLVLWLKHIYGVSLEWICIRHAEFLVSGMSKSTNTK